MSIFKKILGMNSKSAQIARDRLQIVVSHQRVEGADNDFLPRLRHELLTVVCKYVRIDRDQVNAALIRKGSCSILELNITLPEPHEQKRDPDDVRIVK